MDPNSFFFNGPIKPKVWPITILSVILATLKNYIPLRLKRASPATAFPALQIVNRVIKSVLISLPKMADLSPEIRRPLKEMRLKILSDSWPEGNSQFMIWLKIL